MRSMDTMAYFRTNSERLQRAYPGLLKENRGIGNTLVTMIWSEHGDEVTQSLRDELVNNLLNR